MKPLLFFLLSLLIVANFIAPLPAGAGTSRHGIRLAGDGPNYINLAVGSFEGFDDHDDSIAGQVEIRGGKKLLRIGPLAGIHANLDGGLFGYAGLYVDLGVGPFVLSPQTSIGAYEKGESKELGGTFQFMSGIGLSYEFADLSRLGVRYQHISNANLHDKNPGADILLLNYGIAF